MYYNMYMIYENIYEGVFLERPNRFIAYVQINGRKEIVHVKNTGRCKELLTEQAAVFCQKIQNPARKTKFDLIAVQKGERLINMDSQAPNRVFREYLELGRLFEDIQEIKPECAFQNSRFDFFVKTKERRIFAEVKGVTLEENGVVSFPDAPTERGLKHIYELIEAKKQGYEAYAVFVIQMENVKYFTPNTRTHAAFAQALREAERQGVNLRAIDCKVTPDTLSLNREVPVCLDGLCSQNV